MVIKPKQTYQKLVMKDDILFKAFFSKKGNEKYIKDFLIALLGEEIEIKNIIHDARLEQLARESKYGVLDLDVELKNGEIINIEMQMRDHRNIEERTTFYASKKVVEQLSPGEKYDALKYGEYEVLTGSAENKRLQEIRLMSYLEEQSALATARNNGEKRGLEEGQKQKQIEIAKKMIEKNIPIEEIIDLTGLTKEEIEKIKEVK